MKIVIIGDGKVGHKLTTQLSEEDYDITLIDQNAGKLKAALNNLDIFCINGNGADAEVLKQADPVLYLIIGLVYNFVKDKKSIKSTSKNNRLS